MNLSHLATRCFAICVALASAAHAQRIPWTGRDQTADLQSAISASTRLRETIELEGRDYLITDSLRWSRIGLGLAGVAPGIGHRPHPAQEGAATRLVWRGGENGRMLLLEGTHASIRRITLSGKLLRNELRPPGLVGIAWRRGAVGTGKSSITDFSAHNLDVAVQCGEPGEVGASNIDVLHWGGLFQVTNSRCAYQINAHMSMGHHFSDVHLVNTEVFAEVFAGGSLYVDSLAVISPCTLLAIRTPGPGSNNGTFVFNNVKVDQQAAGKFKLLTIDSVPDRPVQTTPATSDVTFDGIRIAYDNYTRDGEILAEVRGKNRLTIRDGVNIQGKTLLLKGERRGGKQGIPYVLVDACRMGGGIGGDLRNLIHPDSVPPYTLRARDCVGPRNEVLEDVLLVVE